MKTIFFLILLLAVAINSSPVVDQLLQLSSDLKSNLEDLKSRLNAKKRSRDQALRIPFAAMEKEKKVYLDIIKKNIKAGNVAKGDFEKQVAIVENDRKAVGGMRDLNKGLAKYSASSKAIAAQLDIIYNKLGIQINLLRKDLNAALDKLKEENTIAKKAYLDTKAIYNAAKKRNQDAQKKDDKLLASEEKKTAEELAKIKKAEDAIKGSSSGGNAALKQKVKDLKQEVKEKKDTIESLKRDNKNLKEDKKDLKKKVDTKENKIDALKREIKELKDDKSDLKKDLNKKKETIESLKKDKKNLQGEVTKKLTLVEQLKKKISELEKTNKKLNEKLDNISKPKQIKLIPVSMRSTNGHSNRDGNKYPLSNSVDGNPNTIVRYRTGSSRHYQTFFKLEKKQNIKNLKILVPKKSFSTGFAGVRIYTSDDNKNWAKKFESRNMFGKFDRHAFAFGNVRPRTDSRFAGYGKFSVFPVDAEAKYLRLDFGGADQVGDMCFSIGSIEAEGSGMCQ